MGNEIAVGSSSKFSVEWPEDYFLTQQLPYSDWVKSYGQIANAFSGFWMKWKRAASKMCQEVDIFVSINIFSPTYYCSPTDGMAQTSNSIGAFDRHIKQE